MLLEFLTYSDYNQFEFTDSEVELMAGDFGVSATEIHEMLGYCIKLEMLTLENGIIRSKSLDERLECVYKKRGTKKEFLLQKPHINVVSDTDNTTKNIVSATESTQSKVKEIKVNKKKELVLDADASENYKRFFDWAYTKGNAPRVMAMEKPITADEYDKLYNEIGKDAIFQQVQAMENYKDLHKKNISAYLTIKNWHNRNNS